MGNPDRPELGGGADQQLLPHRPRDRPAVRPRHLPLRQPRRSRRRRGPDAGPAVQRRRRSRPRPSGAYVHEHIPGSTLVQLAATGHCPQPERARGDDERDPGVPAGVSGPDAELGGPGRRPAGPAAGGGPGRPVRERADAATCRRCPTGGSSRSTGRSAPGPGRSADELLGAGFHDLLTDRRPGLPRDARACRCCGCRGRCARSRWTSSGPTAPLLPCLFNAVEVRDDERRPAAGAGHRSSRPPRGGATSRSC